MTRYTVYDNRTDLPVAVEETPERCAEAMGVKLNTFYRAVNRTDGGRWTVLKRQYNYRHKIRLNVADFDALPNVIKITQLSAALGISNYLACKLCKERGIPIISKGKYSTQYISRDEFFKRVRRKHESN